MAVESCESDAFNNGKLAEPKSEAEDEIVSDLSPEVIWLGINDKNEEGTWVYQSDGSRIQYSNFSDPQPDNAGNNEHCVLTNWQNQGWNDDKCEQYVALYVCEI